MGKVFRLHTGDNTLKNWDNSAPYGNTAIKDIKDPNASTSKKEITSIPSPFARMDLVKTAFKNVADNKKLDGDSIHHKLVSDCFDVGEIFFNLDKLKDKVRILVWDPQKDLQCLLDAKDDKHRLFGETLKLYMEQDTAAFNFDRLERIYLLDYIGAGKPYPVNIIGATSPATLFFTSANDLTFVSQNICFGNDRPFDAVFQPLYKRDFEYQRYWYYLRKSIPEFTRLFPEINTYLDLSYQYLNDKQKKVINDLEPLDYDSQFNTLFVDNEANLVEAIGFPLKQKRSSDNIQSDFQINSSIYKAKQPPLVLPVETYTKRMLYTTDLWNKDIKVHYNDQRPVAERELPADGTRYPYLTIGDFLEDYILDNEDEVISDSFFNGCDKRCYLLPLRKEFFTYFTIQELTGKLPDGKKMFELIPNAGGVKAILRIPIQKKEYITYERIYYYDNTARPEENIGGIFSANFNLALFPNIKFLSSDSIHYRIALSGVDLNASLSFYKNIAEVAIKNKFNRNKASGYASNTAYVINDSFDYIVMTVNEHFKGIILPHWKEVHGNNQFTFAIDFGTSNTHIEYSMNGETPQAFNIGNSDKQIHILNNSSLPKRVIYHDYLPEIIGDSTDAQTIFKFPIRTVLSEGATTDWNKAVFPMANTNIPFIFEKEEIHDYNKITTDLKWSNDEYSQKKVKHYLNALFLILRNKVLLNGGQLNTTKIIWFYPASMTEGRYNNFSNIWKDLYKENFGDDISNIIPMSESLAPYYFYRKKKNATTNVVSVDIGGGTTDVVIINNGKEELLTSFRFAANSIFGDGYGFDSDSNGFVSRYKDGIQNILESNLFDESLFDESDIFDELLKVLDALEKQKKSTNIISFFFSLANNKSITQKNINIDFNDMLAGDSACKYTFILFYTAIMYHIARIMKAKNLEMPRHITFSGTGSKVLNILSSSNTTLENFTKLIFELVYEESYSTDGLTLLRELENPKESTCKGGLLNPNHQDYEEVSKLKQTLLGDIAGKFIPTGMKYDEIDEKVITNVLAEVNNFIQLFIRLNDQFPFTDKFSAEYSKWEIVKKCCTKDIKKHLIDGISNKKEEIEKTQVEPKIEETLFFYPLVGILNTMTQEIYKK